MLTLDYRFHVEKLDDCRFKITGRDRHIIIEFGQKLSWEVIEGHISDKHAAMIGQQCLQWSNPNMDEENQKFMDRLNSRE